MNRLVCITSRVVSKVTSRGQLPALYVPCAGLARVTRGRKSGGSSSSELAPPPATENQDPSQAWTAVQDPQSGQTYWWNTVTNETTHLNAPKPLGATLATSPNYTAVAPQGQQGIMQQQQPQAQQPGLGSVLAQGFAFGTGSAIAHNVVGSFFGGGGGGSSGSDGGDAGGGDSWEM